MSRLGLITMLRLGAGLSMSGPLVVLGFELVRTGNTVGGIAFFSVAAVALYLPTYVINQIGGPRAWIRRRLSRGNEQDDDRTGLREWFRRD